MPPKAKEPRKKRGVLHLVSTPIGNNDDITQRALKALMHCDMVICEEAKSGARLLKHYNISKEIDLLNEQNEEEKAPEIIEMLLAGMDLSLISDCGTPVFADPGRTLLNLALQNGIEIDVVPGVTSLMTALVRSGLDLNGFIYSGFLSRDKEERFRQLKELRTETKTIVLLETPYRMMPVLEALCKLMPERNAYIGCNLTMPFETHHYGTLDELYDKFKNLEFKGEFVIVFQGNTLRQYHKSLGNDKPFAHEGEGEDRPRHRSGGERKPYGRRDDSEEGHREHSGQREFRRPGRPSGNRGEGFSRDRQGGGERTYHKRDDNRGGERSYSKRDDRGGERSYTKREDRGGERSYTKRDDRGGERSYTKRDDRGGERRSSGSSGGYGKRSGGSSDFKPRRSKPDGKDGFKKSGPPRKKK